MAEDEFHGVKLRKKIKGMTEIIPRKKEFIRVDQDKCNGCKLCVKFCPSGSFEMENGKAIWKGLETCLEVGLCYHVCPVDAIEWSYPEGGTGIVFKHS